MAPSKRRPVADVESQADKASGATAVTGPDDADARRSDDAQDATGTGSTVVDGAAGDTASGSAAAGGAGPDTSAAGRAEQAPRPLRLAADWSWRLIVCAIVLAGVLWLLSQVKLVAIAFVIGVLLAAALFPFVTALARTRMPRLLATAIVFVIGLGVLVGLGFFVGVQVSNNASALGNQITTLVKSGQDWLVNGPLHVRNDQISSAINSITKKITDTLSTNSQEIASGAVAGLGTGAELVAGIVLALFCTFFLLLDGEEIWSWFVRRFPTRSRERVADGGKVAWRTLSHYVRGTVIIAFTDALAVTITLLIAGVPLAVPVGVLVFLGAFVPVLGLAVTGAFAVGLALISKGPIVAVIVLAVIILAVQFEGHVLQPIIMSRAVRVHPLAVLLSVTAGSIIAGIFGAVIAVPIVAVINNVLTQRSHHIKEPGLPGKRQSGRAAAG